MKKGIVLIVFTIISMSIIQAQEIKKEKEAIKTVIQTAYVDGLQNNGEVKDIENCDWCLKCKDYNVCISNDYVKKIYIETIGQMSPQEIFKEAVNILKKKFEKYIEILE